MSITTMSSREFNRDADGARKAADKGPVIITDRGRPAHVLLSFEDYQKLTGSRRSLLDIVAQDQGDDIDFDPPRMGDPSLAPTERLSLAGGCRQREAATGRNPASDQGHGDGDRT